MLKSLYYRVAELALSLQLCYKETSIWVFSCEIFEVFKNTYFEEHLRTTASTDCTRDHAN